MTLAEARQHIGAGVVYNPRPGTYDSREDGEITSVNDAYVFVLYVGDRRPKATQPEDLTLLASPDSHEWLGMSR
jgi:hypothetical protein